MNIRNAFNFKHVNGLVSCSGTLKKVDLKSLSDEGYAEVINLLPDGSEYSVQEEKEQLENLRIRYDYIPVDWDEPKRSDYDSFEGILRSNLGTKVHIHCAANFRASAFYGIYAFRNLHWTKSDAEEFIASVWQPSEYPIWEKFISDYLGGSPEVDEVYSL